MSYEWQVFQLRRAGGKPLKPLIGRLGLFTALKRRCTSSAFRLEETAHAKGVAERGVSFSALNFFAVPVQTGLDAAPS